MNDHQLLSNVTTQGSRKLYLLESMDVRLGRSTFNHFISFLLRIINEHESLFGHPWSA